MSPKKKLLSVVLAYSNRMSDGVFNQYKGILERLMCRIGLANIQMVWLIISFKCFPLV